ncbi:MAG: 1-acyl-sn-glycerol-3-phosphate acyltransferase [Bacilli bacterium]|nr:1-acyl-sn-glycerol-3-phosphate acyltransferase [Bacilli bacterium]
MGKAKKKKLVLFRHKFWTFVLRIIAQPLFCLLYKFKGQKFNLKKNGPHIILCNHTNNIDPILLSTTFNTPIYYVASEQLFYRGFLSKLLIYLFGIISKSKSMPDASTIKNIKRIIDEKGSVGMFVEGNVTFTGENPETPFAVCKLIKFLKAPVLLYRMHGLYLSSPRWAFNKRRGKTYGEIAKIIQYDEYSKLSDQELFDLIVENLYVNCYDDQAKNPIIYKGENLAEGIERLLVVCPNCGSIESIHSKGDEFECLECKSIGKFNHYGMIESESYKFANLIEYDYNVKKQFINNLKHNNIVYSCKVEVFNIVKPKRVSLGFNVVSIDKEKIEIIFPNETRVYTYDRVSQVCIQSKNQIIIYLSDGNIVLLKGDNNFKPYLFLMVFQYYKNLYSTDTVIEIEKLGV